MEKINIHGVMMDNVTMDEALGFVVERLDGPGIAKIYTPNSEIMMQAQRDPALKDILNQADLLIADGAGVVLASRILRRPLKEKVSGIDLVKRILENTRTRPTSFFILGAKPGVAEKAAINIISDYPKAEIKGWHHGYFQPAEEDGIIEKINDSGAEVLLVGLGAPKQEKWIYRHRHSLEVPVAIGIGASLDFIAGSARRAPVWMQHAGAEWLWRLGNEPRRLWRRYAGDFRHLAPGLMRYWLLTRQTRSPRPPEEGADEIRAIGPRAIRVAGRFGADQRGAFEALALQTLAGEASEPMQSAGATSPHGRPGHVYVDLTACTYIDSAGLGCLASLAHEARARGYEFRVYPGSPAIRRLLGLGGLDQHLGTADDVEGVG